MPLLENTISTIIQIALFSLIPFLFFFFTKRKEEGSSFLNYIGFYKPPSTAIKNALLTSLLFLIIGVGAIIIDENIKGAVFSDASDTGFLRLLGLSFSTILLLLVLAVFKTALAEEILFRGFIAKRLMNKFGFSTGNLIQALIFGLIHLLLFYALTKSTVPALLFLFLFSSLAAWLIGYINEQQGNGSIIPGWIAHALGNTLSYAVIAFVL